MKKLWVFVVVMAAATASAQRNPPPTGRILVPTLAKSTPGAFGSIWITEFSVVNSNTTATTLDYARTCPSSGCPTQTAIAAGAYRDVNDFLNSASGSPALFVYVPPAAAPLMEFSLRVRNLTVQAQTFGAEVPVVREEAAFTRPFSLLNVPIDPRFRHLLRIYDFTGQTGSVKVEYLSIPGGSVLAQRTVSVFGESSRVENGLAYPSFGLAQQPPEIAGAERVRIRISPLDSSQKLWAFVSFTNNETQEVTNITPQQ